MNHIFKSYTISKELPKCSVKSDLHIFIDKASCDSCIFIKYSYQNLCILSAHLKYPDCCNMLSTISHNVSYWALSTIRPFCLCYTFKVFP